jgi:hypothetical protein
VWGARNRDRVRVTGRPGLEAARAIQRGKRIWQNV